MTDTYYKRSLRWAVLTGIAALVIAGVGTLATVVSHKVEKVGWATHTPPQTKLADSLAPSAPVITVYDAKANTDLSLDGENDSVAVYLDEATGVEYLASASTMQPRLLPSGAPYLAQPYSEIDGTIAVKNGFKDPATGCEFVQANFIKKYDARSYTGKIPFLTFTPRLDRTGRQICGE